MHLLYYRREPDSFDMFCCSSKLYAHLWVLNLVICLFHELHKTGRTHELHELCEENYQTLQCLAFKRNKLSSIIQHVNGINLTSNWPYPFYSLWLICILCMVSFYIIHSQLYFLQEQSESVLTKCEKTKDYGAMIKGRYCLMSLLGWQHAAFTHTLGLCL